RLDTAVRVTRHSKRLAAPFSADPVRITFNMAAVEPESKPTESNRQRGTCDWRQLGLGSQVQHRCSPAARARLQPSCFLRAPARRIGRLSVESRGPLGGAQGARRLARTKRT